MDEIRGVPLIKQIDGALEREINNRVRSQGVTLAQIQLLLTLSAAENGTLPFKELERRCAVSQATIAGILKRLKDKKLVEVLDDPTDGRVRHAQITAAGLAACGDAHVHMDALERRLVSGLTEIEARLFLELLRKVSSAIK
ncbi:MAG: MarR family transcriptional regulator [Oscillospiraceae bacterium]|nr:MarR family transcriptional regulator [Oscillospiraceae bacterium]